MPVSQSGHKQVLSPALTHQHSVGWHCGTSSLRDSPIEIIYNHLCSFLSKLLFSSYYLDNKSLGTFATSTSTFRTIEGIISIASPITYCSPSIIPIFTVATIWRTPFFSEICVAVKALGINEIRFAVSYRFITYIKINFCVKALYFD